MTFTKYYSLKDFKKISRGTDAAKSFSCLLCHRGFSFCILARPVMKLFSSPLVFNSVEPVVVKLLCN